MYSRLCCLPLLELTADVCQYHVILSSVVTLLWSHRKDLDINWKRVRILSYRTAPMADQIEAFVPLPYLLRALCRVLQTIYKGPTEHTCFLADLGPLSGVL